MKKIYAFLTAVLISTGLSAQLTSTVNNGVFSITYGASGDWSFYDPQGASEIWVHVWSNKTDGQNDQGNYNDDWNNSNVKLTYDSGAAAFKGTIDLNTKLFTGSNNTMPQGTVVQKVGIVFKDQQVGATHQSSDTFLNGPTTLSSLAVSDINNLSKKSAVVSGKLITPMKGNLDLTFYDYSGRVLKTQKVISNGTPIELNLSQKGLMMVKVSGNNTSEVVKFSN